VVVVGAGGFAVVVGDEDELELLQAARVSAIAEVRTMGVMILEFRMRTPEGTAVATQRQG
jgi:hypothetical protein